MVRALFDTYKKTKLSLITPWTHVMWILSSSSIMYFFFIHVNYHFPLVVKRLKNVDSNAFYTRMSKVRFSLDF